MSRSATAGQVYLETYLAPFAQHLARPDVTDIYVNRPEEIWVETLSGGVEQHWVAGLTPDVLSRLARQVAAHTHQGINREHPVLSAALPGGERIQIVIPPATRKDVAIAIRRQVSADYRLADYQKDGLFDTLRGVPAAAEIDARLRALHDLGDYVGLLSEAVQRRRNLLISGGTSTGKTTFLNALIREIPEHERLIFIEDTPELVLRHANAIGLLATRGELGEATTTAEDLLTASLRMRPDRIILGELRGSEAFAFLRAVNTGHPGSMTTVHADSPDRAVEQIALLVLQSGARLSRQDVIHYVRSTMDVFVQIERADGRRRISAIELRAAAPS